MGGDTLSVLLQQALVGTAGGAKMMMMMADSSDGGKSYYLNASYVPHMVLSAVTSLLYLVRQIFFILCPFCS